jgi:hypothetical protein
VWAVAHLLGRWVACLAFFSLRFSFNDFPDFFDWCWRGDLSAISCSLRWWMVSGRRCCSPDEIVNRTEFVRLSSALKGTNWSSPAPTGANGSMLPLRHPTDTGRTFLASSLLRPGPTSNSTVWPSARVVPAASRLET